MANTDVILPVNPAKPMPEVRTITLGDLQDSLARGLDDFWSMPTHAIFLCMIYPVIGALLFSLPFNYNIVPLMFPIAAGFSLVGPLAAIFLYELSRRRELGLDTSWRHAFDIVHSPSLWPIIALALILLTIFALWIACAQAIFLALFGYGPVESLSEFARRVFSTPEGLRLILIGNGVGFLFAVVAGSVSVVSFPLLLDRDVGFPAAVLTSLAAIGRNPGVMAVWGLIVGAALVLGTLPFFLGLAIVMPVLGHATWHLYRKVVVPEAATRPEFQPGPRAVRFAADFPACLFAPSAPIDRNQSSSRS